MAKRRIQASTIEQIRDFVSTYSYWAVLDSSEILSSSENSPESDFEENLTSAIDIATKRGKQFLTVRVGSNEKNSRTNDEMLVELAMFNQQIETFAPAHFGNTPTLNGFPSRPLNNTGITATEMQTYLNGALDRQKQEMQLINQSTLAGFQAEMSKQKAESEIALMKQMHQQEMQFERRMLAYEREQIQQKLAELEALREDFEDEKQRNNEGIKGFTKTLAGWYNDLTDDFSKPEKKDKELKGKDENEDHEELTKEATPDFQFEEEETQETDEFDILNGIDDMDNDSLEAIQELIAEKLEAAKKELSKTENTNDTSNQDNEEL